MAAVRILKLQSNRGNQAEIPDSDDAILASIINEAGGATTGNVYGAADSNTDTVNLGTGASVTSVTIGGAGTTTTLPGNLEVQGTTTTIDTDNLRVADRLILLNNGAATEPADSMGIAMERGSSSSPVSGDAVMLYSTNSVDRFEFGYFDTSGGTTPPSGTLTNFGDVKISDLLLAGTNITADGALTVESSGSSALTVGGTATGAINVGADAVDRTITLGNATGANALDIVTGTSGFSASSTGTTSDAISLQVSGVGGGIDIDAQSTGTLDLDGGTVNLGASNASTISVGNATGATAVNIDSGTGNVNIDSQGTTSSAISITAEGAGGGVDIDADSAGAVSIDGGNVNVNTGSSTGRTTIGNPDNGGIVSIQSTDEINIGTAEGTGDTRTITIGNSVALGTVKLLSGDSMDIESSAAMNILSGGALTVSADANSSITMTQSNQVLTVQTIGGGTSQIVVDSDGTGADAIVLNASAGGFDIDGDSDSSISVASGLLVIESTGSNSADGVEISASDGDVYIYSSFGNVNIEGSDTASDITFSALGSDSESYNQSGDLELNSSFTAAGITSLIGAFNAIQDGRVALSAAASSANDIQNTYTVAAGQTLEEGDAVYISGNDEVSLASATSISTADFIGFAASAASAGATVSIVTDGVQASDLIPGLTVGAGAGEVAAGVPVFLSLTPGKLTTDDSSFGSGNVVARVGILKDIQSYDGATGNEQVEIQIRVGEQTTLA